MLLLPAVLLACAADSPRCSDSPSSCAKQLLARMNLTEKISMIHGNDKCNPPQPTYCRGYTGYVKGIPRLGIPPLQMNDGPQGFRMNGAGGSTTAFPAGLAMAATWDPDAVKRWGAAMGKEFVAKGPLTSFRPSSRASSAP